MQAVALVVGDRRDRGVDRDLVEVRSAQPRELRVHVRMDPTGEQRIVAEVDAGNDVSGAERHLFGLGEEIIRIAVQYQAANDPNRDQFFRHDLGGVEHIETELLGLFFSEHLQPELPFGIGTGLDRFPKVAPMEVRIGAGNADRLVPDQRMRPLLGLPVEFAEHRLSVGVDQAKSMDAEALHHPEAARDGAIRHHPHQHVRRFGAQRDEVPERVVCRSRLRHGVVRLRLDGMDQIRELHRVLDEEHRNVVADQIPVTGIGVELDGESTNVSRGIDRAALAGHGREADEYRRHLSLFLERRRHREVGDRLGALEEPVRARAARVNDPLRDPFVVEVRDFLAQDEVFEQRGTTQSGLERVLVVGDRHALVGGQHLARGIGTYSIERVDGRVDTGAGRGARLVAGVALRQRAGADSRRGRRYMSAFRRVVACVQAEGPGQVTGLIDGRHSLVDRGRLVGERIAVGRRRRRGWPAGRAPSSGLGVWGRGGRSGFRLLHVVCLSRVWLSLDGIVDPSTMHQITGVQVSDRLAARRSGAKLGDACQSKEPRMRFRWMQSTRMRSRPRGPGAARQPATA